MRKREIFCAKRTNWLLHRVRLLRLSFVEQRANDSFNLLCNSLKEITLTRGQCTLVDDKDFDWLNQWKWYAVKTKYQFYVPGPKWLVLSSHVDKIGVKPRFMLSLRNTKVIQKDFNLCTSTVLIKISRGCAPTRP